jgi:hypothetical protein
MSLATINASGIIYIWQNENIFFYSNVYNKTNALPFIFPTLISNVGTDLIVYFISDFIISNVNNYFICMSNNITFDGNNTHYTTTINGIQNYKGFIKSNGFSNIIVNNITLKTINNSTLMDGGGWICQTEFGSKTTSEHSDLGIGLGICLCNNSTGCKIINCSSDGEINNYSGGIVGSYSTATVENCHSIGNINGMQSGGIFGMYANAKSSCDCNVINCFSMGDINGIFSGGIFGMFPNVGSSGNCNAINCHSEGKINGISCGGIFGSYANDTATGNCIAENCYSLGDINSTKSGGIFSSQANNESKGSCISNNCYNTGIINGLQVGGIFGFGANFSASGECIATKCYNLGNINGSNSGGIFGMIANAKASGNCIATKCYNRGHINGSCSGGIFGMSANYSSAGLCNAKTCYSSGFINGNFSGGIFGSLINSFATLTGITNAFDCYSIGDINNNAGGIFGSSANVNSFGNCNAINCYSRGLIKGINAGGIFASFANYDSNKGNCNAVNCYSSGNITGDFTGGIFGYRPKDNNGLINVINPKDNGLINVINPKDNGLINIINPKDNGLINVINPKDNGLINVINCYTSGLGNNNGIFTKSETNGKDNYNTTLINGFQNYSEANNGNSGIWNNSNAHYTDIHQYGLYMSENIWLIPNNINDNIPFLLLSYDDKLYNTNSVTVEINHNTALTILGDGTEWFVNDNNVQISNIEKGQLITLIPGIYNIYIINGFSNNLMSIYGYNIELFTLNVINNISTRNYTDENVNTIQKLIIQKNKKRKGNQKYNVYNELFKLSS